MSKSVAILLLLIALAGAEDNPSKGKSTQNDAESTVSKVVNTPKNADPVPSKPITTQNNAVPPSVVTEEDVKADGKTRTSLLTTIETQNQNNIHDKEEKVNQNAMKDEGKENKVTGDVPSPTSRDSDKGIEDTPTSSNGNKGIEDTPTSSNGDKGIEDTQTPTKNDNDTSKDIETNSEGTELIKETDSKTKTDVQDLVVGSSEETKTLKRTINDETGKKGEVWDISLKCRDCLCYFATDCDMERKCENPRSIFGLGDGFEKGDCGPFHISFPFWCDAHNIQMDLGDATMENEWRLCSLDLLCTTETIQKYFHKYPHDCNGDGKVDCLDYAAIHTLGPFGCLDKVKLDYWNRVRRKEMLQCMVSEETGPYAKKMQELQAKLRVQDIAAWKLEEIEKRKKSATEDSITNPVEHTVGTMNNLGKPEEGLTSSGTNPESSVKNPEKSNESDSEENHSSGEKYIVQT